MDPYGSQVSNDESIPYGYIHPSLLTVSKAQRFFLITSFHDFTSNGITGIIDPQELIYQNLWKSLFQCIICIIHNMYIITYSSKIRFKKLNPPQKNVKIWYLSVEYVWKNHMETPTQPTILPCLIIKKNHVLLHPLPLVGRRLLSP